MLNMRRSLCARRLVLIVALHFPVDHSDRNYLGSKSQFTGPGLVAGFANINPRRFGSFNPEEVGLTPQLELPAAIGLIRRFLPLLIRGGVRLGQVERTWWVKTMD